MTITFFSNFMNHHQLPFSLEMIKLIGDNYKFVATQYIPEERKKLGYADMNKKYDFIVRAYDNESEAYRLGIESDIVIIGSAPQKFIKKRLKSGKITLRYAERIFKNPQNFIRCLPLIIRLWIYERKNTYLLCSSAYSASDFNILNLYKNKTYKWGYFPEVKKYENITDVINMKEENSIIWVGRFVNFKHPEIAVKLAKSLKENGYKFTLRMIGIGRLKKKIQNMIHENELENYVKLLGSMSPERVREYMEKSKIFIFTSDKGEGWGAVLNEAMNSACAVIANNEIGSVPFLINNNNGYKYEKNNIKELYDLTIKLLSNNEEIKKIGLNAYKNITEIWNPKEAAKRLVNLSSNLLNNDELNIFNEGPCSKD